MVQPESQNFWKIWHLRKTIVIGKLLIEPFYEEVLTYSPGVKHQFRFSIGRFVNAQKYVFIQN